MVNFWCPIVYMAVCVPVFVSQLNFNEVKKRDKLARASFEVPT